VESLFVSIRQVSASICNCMFWLEIRPTNSPLSLGFRHPV